MFFLNAAFTLGVSGGINFPNQYEIYDKVRGYWNTPTTVEKNIKPVSGVIGLDIGSHESWGKFGLFTLASVGYTLGLIVQKEEIKETWFFQASLKPEFQIVKMFSLYCVVALKATRLNIGISDPPMSIISMPLGLGICIKPISKLFLTLEGTYNKRFSTSVLKIGAPVSVKLGVAYAF